MIYIDKFTDDELILVCSSKHKLANAPEVSLDELSREPLILREPGSGTRQVFEDALHRAGFDPSKLKILMQLGTTHSIKALVAENIGMTVISERTVRDELDSGVLKRLVVPSIDLKRSFNFIFKRDIRLSQITRLFITTCRELVDVSY